MTSSPVRWGIVGPGGIAREFFEAARKSETGIVDAVASRDPDFAALSNAFPTARVLAGYETLLGDPRIDAVYVATPHPHHHRWVMRALELGKHVLCEKPMSMSAADTKAMFAAARSADLFLAEAFMYRSHPLTRFLLDLLDRGAVGDLRLLKSSFGFSMRNPDPGHRLMSLELGGGAILDIGGYPVSMARLLAGHASGRVIEPERLQGAATFGETGVDVVSSAILTFPNGVIAQLGCSVTAWQDNVLHIVGSTGRLEVPDFWFGSGKGGGTAEIRLVRNDGTSEVLKLEEAGNVYSFQFEAANDAIRRGARELAHPAMDAADSIGNAEVVDSWLTEVGYGGIRT